MVNTMVMTKLEHALSLASQGFHVFPLFQNKKTPAITQWQKNASTDPDTIKHWWSGTCHIDNGKGRDWYVSPESNIGIHTVDHVVIDIDVKNGEDGRIALAQMPSCKTRISKSVTGAGFHILFKCSDKSINNMTKFRPGIDIRTKGGFIAAPGTVVDGKEYKWVNPDVPIAELPQSLSTLIKAGVAKSSQSDPNSDFGEYKNDYSTIPDSVPAGGRDDTLLSFACSWRERNLTRDQAEIMMRELYSKLVQPEGDVLEWDAALAKIDQAWQAYEPGGMKDPAITIKPTIEPSSLRSGATLQDAIDYFIFVESGSRVADTRRHPVDAVMSLQDFKNSMQPDTSDGKPIVNAWMRSPNRQTVRDIGYFPQEMLPVFERNGSNFFNTYYGPGLDIVSDIDTDLVQLFDDHLHFMYPDPKSYELIMDWMAFTVQYPHERIPWCFLTISIKEGIGKGLMYALISKVVGEHNSSIVQPDELSESGGAHNGYISNKTLVCWDEIKTKAADHERLRLLITSPQLMINHKYGAKGVENIFANTMAFSNHLNSLHVGASDRRFFVECNYDSPKSRFYYDRLWRAVNGDLPKHWLALLKKRDVSRFAWSSAPADTDAKRAMMDTGQGDVERLIRDCIEEGIGPFAADIICPNIARLYIERVGPEYGISDVTPAVTRKISGVIKSICPPLPRAKYTIPTSRLTATPTRVRCSAIRRHDFWSLQDPAAISCEYAKARIMAEKNINKESAADEVRKIVGG